MIDLSLKWDIDAQSVTVVIPGATNKFQVKMNTAVSEKNILSLMKINKIYEENIKKDVHRKMVEFKNKNVLITGASRGIGYDIAKEFLLNGANIIICSQNQKK